MKKIIENKYFKLGLTVFLIVAACISFFFLIYKIKEIADILKWLCQILSPFIIGFTFAYLLNPLVKFFEELVYKVFFKKGKQKEETKNKISRITGITIICIIAITSIVLLFNFIIPELLESIEILITNLPLYLDKIKNYLTDLLKNHEELENIILNNYDSINSYFMTTINDTLLPKIEEWIVVFSNGVFGAVKVLFNLIMGFIISIYFLHGKEEFRAQTKKVLYGLFSVKTANNIVDNARHTDRIFGYFIIGKILETLVISVMSFVFLALFGYPYALLISVIIGITNIIPYFGPFIGGVPSAFLILLQTPSKFWPFIIFLIVLQQIDNYIVGPKLTGTQIGIKSFWVLFAIMVFGGIFGLVGMLIGVPIFALLYGYFGNKLNLSLAKKKLPIETYKYEDIERINSETNKIVNNKK